MKLIWKTVHVVVASSYSWFVTVPLGLEDISGKEIRDIVGCDVNVDVGKVFFKANLDAMYRVNYAARTINRLHLLLARENFEKLEDIYRVAKSIDYTQVITPNTSFAVRCERIGNHGFTSIDVARVVGKAVIDSYVESRGIRPKVNLDEPDVEISTIVRFNEILISVNTTGDSLHRRRYRVYNHPAALKTTLAAAMLRIGEYCGQSLLDPLCGGATIPIEAAHMARKYPVRMFREDYLFARLPLHDPELEQRVREELFTAVNNDIYDIYCMEISPKHLKGAVENAKSARVVDTVKFLLRDATRRESYIDLSPQLVVTNPPYGMRSHNLKKIESFYRDILALLKDLYGGKKLVLITASRKQLESAVEKVGVVVEKSRQVMHGGLPAKIYVVKL